MRKTIAGIILSAAVLAGSVGYTEAPPMEITADEIQYNSVTQDAMAKGHVVIKREDGIAKAEQAIYNVKQETGKLFGGVNAQKGDQTLVCDELTVVNKNHIIATGGNVVVTKGGSTFNAPGAEYFDDRQFLQSIGDWATMTKEDGSSLSAGYINYDMKAGRAQAQDNVKINAPSKNLRGAGDHAEYIDLKDGHNSSVITLTGNAWAIQDGNRIVGEKLVFNSDTQAGNSGEASGKVIMVMPPSTQKTATEPGPTPLESATKILNGGLTNSTSVFPYPTK